MDERIEGEEITRAERRRRSAGRWPVRPMIPLVALVTISVGLAAGYGLGAKAVQAPTPPPQPSIVASRLPPATPTASLAPIPTATPSTAETPPSGGLSIIEAMTALDRELGPSSVLSARLIRYPAVSADWVWQLVVPYSAVDCGPGSELRAGLASGVSGSTASAAPSASTSPCRTISTTEMVLLDYRTGLLLEDRIPAG
jgi:hypothetical protein